MNMESLSTSQPAAPDASITGLWLRHATVFAVALAALGFGFYRDIEAAVIVWYHYPAYSHCYLIIPISAWLVWERRAELLTITPRSQPWLLLAAIPFLATWLIGYFATITEVRQFSIVLIAEVFIAATFGLHVFRRFLFACLYLLFLVPTGQYLIPPLQEITAKFVEVGLDLAAIPNFRDGLIFQLENGLYEIAEACAGLRFLVATVALGALFAHLVYRKTYKTVLFLIACVVVPIIGNSLRALITVMVANYTNNEVAAGFDHLVYGWAFAVVIIFILLFAGSKFRDPEPAASPAAPLSLQPQRESHGPLGVTLAALLVVAATAPAIAAYADSRSGTANQAALEELLQLQGWHAVNPRGDWHIEFSKPTIEGSNSLVRDGTAAPAVDMDVHFYVRDRNAPSLLASTNHPWQKETWNAIERSTIQQNIKGLNIPLNEAVINVGDNKRLVWTTYWIDGRFTTSSMAVRLLEFRAGVTNGHSAVVSLSTPVNTTTDDARQRLLSALTSFDNLPAGLERVGTETGGEK